MCVCVSVRECACAGVGERERERGGVGVGKSSMPMTGPVTYQGNRTFYSSSSIINMSLYVLSNGPVTIFSFLLFCYIALLRINEN